MLQPILLLTLATTVLCQFDMMPDVRFGEDNERFDVDAIVKTQNRLFQEQMQMADDDDDDHYRRRNSERRSLRHHSRRRNSKSRGNRRDFQHRDDREDLRRHDYEDSLEQNLDLHPVDDFRRGMNRRNEVEDKAQLLNYAVPIDVKIKGYLKAPLTDQRFNALN